MGSKELTPEKLSKELYDLFDIICSQRDSLYKGEYFIYKGLYADYMSIEYNNVGNDYKEGGFKEYKTLVYLSYIKGKNKDKLSRSKHFKKMLVNREGIDYLREEIVTDDNTINICKEDIIKFNANSLKNWR